MANGNTKLSMFIQGTTHDDIIYYILEGLWSPTYKTNRMQYYNHKRMCLITKRLLYNNIFVIVFKCFILLL